MDSVRAAMWLLEHVWELGVAWILIGTPIVWWLYAYAL